MKCNSSCINLVKLESLIFQSSAIQYLPRSTNTDLFYLIKAFERFPTIVKCSTTLSKIAKLCILSRHCIASISLHTREAS